MDKKNTMLLTVIAVATLLVAVVGATFAYFNVTATNNTSDAPTVIQGTSEEVGSVALNMGKELHLDVTAEDMSQAGAGTTKLYSNTVSGNRKEAVEDTLVTAAVTGGSATTNYECTFTLKVSTDTTTMTFSKEEAKLHLVGESGVQIATQDFDLADIETTNSSSVTFDILGSKTTDTDIIKGYVELANTEEPQQDNIAGKSLKVSLTAENFSCKTKTAE